MSRFLVRPPRAPRRLVVLIMLAGALAALEAADTPLEIVQQAQRRTEVTRSTLTFAPDRGASRSIVGRIRRTVSASGSFALEGGVRQNGHGVYGKAEYSQTHGQHLRTTATVIGLGGRSDDFFGQYRRNSHAVLALRYSF